MGYSNGQVTAMNEVFGRPMGPYILLEQLGKGGMAQVYNAFDPRVDRNVAIKVILLKHSSPEFRKWFEEEAHTLAGLAHTNIVRVYDYGIHENQPYLVMEYAPGGNLQELMQKKMPWQTAAAILAPIAQALEYVHSQGIVHRDVKPSNILLHEDFSPVLADFGILKILRSEDEKNDPVINEWLGTSEYMAPEASENKFDFRADIYSLGVVFYEMVTGRKPYIANSAIALAVMHNMGKLTLPTQIDKTIPKFVEQAILRAVQKTPENRYESMGHFAEVLHLIAKGKVDQQWQISRLIQRKEKVPFSRSVITLSLLIIVGVLAISYGTYAMLTGTGPFHPTSSLTPSLAAASPTLMPQKGLTPTSTTASSTALAWTATPEPITPFPANSSVVGDFPAIPINTISAADVNPAGFQEKVRWGVGGVNVAKWSPDGKMIALGTTNGIFIYDTASQTIVRFIDAGFNVAALAFHPRSTEIMVGGADGTAQAWDYQSGKFLREYTYRVNPSANIPAGGVSISVIKYSPVSNQVAVGHENGVINVYQADKKEPDLVMANYRTVKDLAFSYDGRFIFAGNKTNNIDIWNLLNGTKDARSLSNPGTVSKLSISGNGGFLLAGGGGNGSVYLWDPISRTLLISFLTQGGIATDFGIASDNSLVAIGLDSGAVEIFEMPAEYTTPPLPLRTIQSHADPLLSLEFSPDGLLFAVANHEEGMKIWNAGDASSGSSLALSLRAIEEIQLSSDGLWLATAHADGVMRLWSVQEARLVLQEVGSLPKGVPFSPDTRYLAFIQPAGRNKSNIRIVDLATRTILDNQLGSIPSSFVQFSADSKLLVNGNTSSAMIWDVTTWEHLSIFMGGTTDGCRQYFTPQNHFLTLLSGAGVMFDNSSTVLQMCGTNPQGAILKYFFKNQNLLLFVKVNGELWIGNSNSRDLSSLNSQDSYPNSDDIFLAGHQQSGWYAYVSDARIIIRNINGSPTSTQIGGQQDYGYRLAFSPDAGLMALGSRYGSIHIWSMP